MSDLYVESENFRLIYDNYEMRDQAEKIFEETGDVKKVDDFCKSLFLKKRAEGLS